MTCWFSFQSYLKRELNLIPERHLNYKLDNCRNAAIHEFHSIDIYSVRKAIPATTSEVTILSKQCDGNKAPTCQNGGVIINQTISASRTQQYIEFHFE